MPFNKYWGLPKNYKDFFNLKTEKQLKEKYGKQITEDLVEYIFLYILEIQARVAIKRIQVVRRKCMNPGGSRE